MHLKISSAKLRPFCRGWGVGVAVGGGGRADELDVTSVALSTGREMSALMIDDL